MIENNYEDVFSSPDSKNSNIHQLWPSPASHNNYSTSESEESDKTVYHIKPDGCNKLSPSNLFAKLPTTENIKVTSALADHNYCATYKEQENEDIGAFQKILQSYEKNNTVVIEKFQTTKSIQSKKCQKYTFFGTWVQDYLRRVVIKRHPTENEKNAYKRIIPILENLKVNPPVWPVPKYSMSRDMIIFEDLSAEGFRKIEDKTFTVPECSMVLLNLAEFHTTSLIMLHSNPVEFQALRVPPIEDTHSEFKAYLDGLSSTNSFNKIFDKIEVETLRVLIHQAKNDNNFKNKFSAVCHGNLLPKNIFFRENEVRFLDFKKMHYGSIARDVICFMLVNLKPHTYFNSLGYLLDYYFRCLTHSNKFDSVVNINYEFTSDSFKDEVDRVTAYGILYSIWTIPVLYANSQEELESLRSILDNKAGQFNAEFVNRIKTMLTLYYIHYILPKSEVHPNVLNIQNDCSY